jgi:hypothetical protein
MLHDENPGAQRHCGVLGINRTVDVTAIEPAALGAVDRLSREICCVIVVIRRADAAERNSARGFVPYYIDTVRRCHDDDQCVVVMTI